VSADTEALIQTVREALEFWSDTSIGSEEERAQGLASARELIAQFKAATTSALAREILDRALDAAEIDDCYQALKLIRRIVRHEDAVLGNVPANPEPVLHRAIPHQRDD